METTLKETPTMIALRKLLKKTNAKTRTRTVGEDTNSKERLKGIT